MANYSQVDGDETASMFARSSANKEPFTSETLPLQTGMNPAKIAHQRSKVRWRNGLVLCSILVPSAVCIWWIVNIAKHKPGMFSASTIGGQLTYQQAKAIDLISGALFAPLLMLALDTLWFGNAHASIIDQRTNKAIPLASVLEASNSSGGGFNILKIKTILQAKTWTLSLLGLLILVSGFAGKMLQNFIAYEAFNVYVASDHLASLRYLTESPAIDQLSPQTGDVSTLPFSIKQKSDIANQMAGLLTGLSFEDSASKLDAGTAYIGTNATTASLNALDTSIVGLMNVPGYRLSVDCQPAPLSGFNGIEMGGGMFVFDAVSECNTATSKTKSCEGPYTAFMPGPLSIGTSAYNNEYTYVGFSIDKTNALLGYLMSFNDTNTTLSSTWGEVHGKAFNLSTNPLFKDTKSVMTTWTIDCTIMRQEGFHNYTRPSGKGWTISTSSFSDEKSVAKSLLANWQTALNYQAPASAITGIGPPLANTAGSAFGKSANWTIYALNYLYASGEAERISYEIAAQNETSSSEDNLAKFHRVQATMSVQSYRITYIPIILLLAVLGVICAAAITAAMMYRNRQTHSARIGREVDAVRLLVDSIVGLRECAPSMAAAERLTPDELNTWATRFLVRYSETAEGDDVAIHLSRSSDSGMMDKFT
ncbi:hypothetical protein FE257_000773 [Aspergillus nanangensis]|uniref:Uncharacterized protein n=1 Tax=Aspergillus nanangensis TaxID=2582783 RepID=A0AAD4GQ10_ASPNN|nr:hypothetical protein FE257_000773 [Aspergillus nanangensis]